MQTIFPYIMVNNAKEALNYYVTVFNAKLGEIHYGNEIPGLTDSKEAAEVIIYANLTIQNNNVFIAQAVEVTEGSFFPKTIYGNNINVSVMFNNETEQQQAYDNFINSKASIIIPLQMAYWGQKFAIIQDKYNVTWNLGLL